MMLNMKRTVLIIVLFIIAVLLVYIWTSIGYYLSPWGRAHARVIAEKYLDNKYEQKFAFSYVRAPIFDPAYYHIGFLSAGGFYFEVFVTGNHQLFSEFDGSLSSDDYFFCRFDSECKDVYDKIVSSLTNQKYELSVISDLKSSNKNEAGYAAFNEYMSFEQLADLFTWKCYLTIESTLFAEDTRAKVEQIRTIVTGIKSSHLIPNELNLKYVSNDGNNTDWMTFVDLGSLCESEIVSIIIKNLDVS